MGPTPSVRTLGRTTAPPGSRHRKRTRCLFGHNPVPLTYEWISLRGEGPCPPQRVTPLGDDASSRTPEILRFLVANSKPNKAIEFDTGMGLVNLADEYERLAARDLDSEMKDDTLSRRKRVQRGCERCVGFVNR